LDHDDRKKSEYQHVREMIKRDTDEAFFVSVYEKAYEDFEMDN